MIISLALYSLVLRLFGESSGLLYYSLYLLNAGLGLFYLYGSLPQYFNVHSFYVHWLNVTAILVPLFLALFVKSTLKTKQVYRPVDNLLNGVIAFAVTDVVIAITVDLALAMQLATIVFLASFITLIFLTVKYYQKNHPLIKIFFVAYAIYIVGMSITMLSFYGFIEFNEVNFYASGIGLVIEALLFSYLLRYNSLMLEEEVREGKINEDKLAYLANHDPLTKLANRRLFMELSETMLHKAHRSNEQLAILFIDLDGFKAINDTYGHLFGDEALREVSHRIKQELRESDVVARIGGDEFVVLVSEVKDETDVFRIAEKLITKISIAYKFNGSSTVMGASIGISFYPKSDDNIEGLLKKADEAMFSVKNTSKNSWKVYGRD